MKTTYGLFLASEPYSFGMNVGDLMALVDKPELIINKSVKDILKYGEITENTDWINDSEHGANRWYCLYKHKILGETYTRTLTLIELDIYENDSEMNIA